MIAAAAIIVDILRMCSFPTSSVIRWEYVTRGRWQIEPFVGRFVLTVSSHPKPGCRSASFRVVGASPEWAALQCAAKQVHRDRCRALADVGSIAG
jgi:hypothetical protein